MSAGTLVRIVGVNWTVTTMRHLTYSSATVNQKGQEVSHSYPPWGSCRSPCIYAWGASQE
ncbi:hypothetical protein KTH_40510 [Thermosporothrix hazakensis]|nr:hypothetical protein KTH_40510 [Thermosporothrix hazakensis]